MKKSRKWAYGSMITLALMAAAVIALRSLLNDWVYTEYATLKEAEQDMMMGGEWLPAYLPPSSSNLAEKHNLDTNEMIMSFNYQPGDMAGMRAACEKETRVPGGTEFQCSRYTITLFDDGRARLYHK